MDTADFAARRSLAYGDYARTLKGSGMYDPLTFTKEIEERVVNGPLRKYYRLIRKDRWYGGICTSDCVGCNLRCVFCWSNHPRDFPEKAGAWYSPQQVFDVLIACARKHRINQLRISGNEPTIGKLHLLEVLRLVDTTSHTFILETNGTLIDASYARELSRFKNVHVRVSLKGAGPEEFSLLTGASPEFFQLQLDALRNLFGARVKSHPAVMLSFSTRQSIKDLKGTLKSIDHSLVDNLEEEYVFLYPHVAKRLREARIKPSISYDLGKIPKELV